MKPLRNESSLYNGFTNNVDYESLTTRNSLNYEKRQRSSYAGSKDNGNNPGNSSKSDGNFKHFIAGGWACVWGWYYGNTMYHCLNCIFTAQNRWRCRVHCYLPPGSHQDTATVVGSCAGMARHGEHEPHKIRLIKLGQIFVRKIVQEQENANESRYGLADSQFHANGF